MGDSTQLAFLTLQLQETLEKGRKSEHLNPPREEMKTLIREKDAGEGDKCLCWGKFMSLLQLCLNKLCLSKDDSFDAGAEKQAQMAKDVKETLYKVRGILELISKDDFEGKFSEAPIKRPFGVPENPKFTVGLDVPLNNLKVKLLKDGVSVIVLSGLGGSGKTTLATMLCLDEEIKGKFKENILFVTFSKTPNLKNIVERVFGHCGYPVPEFQSDDDAVNQLGLLLSKIEGSQVLLVLDDVWPGSEALIEKFRFHISNYKILVTSRVTFPRFGTPCILKPLVHEDAMTLFHHCALLEKSNLTAPDEDLVQKVVRNCKGLPIALKVIGTSLSHQPNELRQKTLKELSLGHSILASNTDILAQLQKILDVLQDNPIIKECFMDLALFPEDQRIPVASLIDMWAEVYGLDDDGIEAMAIINKLDSMNLANLLITRKSATDADSCYYINHFIVLHDLLRELGIYQSTQQPIEQRKRLIIDTNENERKWWFGKKQQGMMARMLSKIRTRCIKPNPQLVPARTLSISTDESCASDWSYIEPAQVEVLILNHQTKQYSFPEFMEKLSKLKVLTVTNYGFRPSELNNFELLGSLPNLKRIRLERISVLSFGTLKNVKKLSLYMCDTRHAFEKGNIRISDAFPNLVDLSIDYCIDMVRLPTGLCDITPLKKLSITNCHKLSALPQEIGNLENLELLRLSSCTDLEGLPDSIGKLSNLQLLDISDCLSLTNLPDDISILCTLRNIYMTGCAACELPVSVANLENLKVTCDEETAASWEAFEPMMTNLKIEVHHVDINLNWLHAIPA